MHHRLPAVDRMRGIAMALMATDHASGAFNAGRPVNDSVLFPGWDDPLPTEFWLRWVSHLCAPAFLFLAGTSLALSIDRRLRRGVGQRAVDRDLVVRGLVILAVEVLFINLAWLPGGLLLQVLYAIGLSFVAMVLLRRLPSALLLGFAGLVWLLGEWTRPLWFFRELEPRSVADAFLLGGGGLRVELPGFGWIMVAYPVLPWLAVMVCGFVLGRRLARDPERPPVRALAWTGAASLVLFVVLRSANGFGNLGLLRQDGSVLQWLHASKYPPSLAFLGLELGLVLLLLAALFDLDRRRGGVFSDREPLLVLGQTAFFFYVLHILVLELSARALGVHAAAGVAEALWASLAVLAICYPACLWFRAIKRRHPTGVLRYF